jgi:hypothetical protein
MPSPFPGMDPFIEDQKWKGFHTRLITALGDALTPQVRPKYIVDVEEYVYLEQASDEWLPPIAPDVAVAESGRDELESSQGGTATVVTIAPVVRTLPMPKRRRQPFLAIRTKESQDVITTIEVLSPWNKAPGEGRREYLLKRQNVFATPAHLVELDLLRGGQRLPTVEPLPPGDYFAFVCRKERLPKVDVYSWSLRNRFPAIPVPLAEGDPDAVLDLPTIFTTTYDRAGYDYALDYGRTLEPPLSEADAEWVRQVLKTTQAEKARE